MQKTYTIIREKLGFMTGRDSSSESSGTLEELIKSHSYTLDCGRSYQHEKGNKKIKYASEIKTIKSLITNLNNAENNAAANGYSGVTYSLKIN